MVGDALENKFIPAYRIMEGFIFEVMVKRLKRSSQVQFPSR